MSKEWIVEAPIVGRVSVYVSAETEDEAKAKALAGDWHETAIDEWKIVDSCRGNVCNLQGSVRVSPNE